MVEDSAASETETEKSASEQVIEDKEAADAVLKTEEMKVMEEAMLNNQ